MNEKVSKTKRRVFGLDIIRAIAIVFVFGTHFINYTGVLETECLSFKWTVFMIFRFLCMSAISLFILLTGYLNNKKEISKKYYMGIIPLYISYLVISLIEIVATSLYTHTSLNVGEIILKLLNFTANSYAWYFEMYMGLFLIIPFLNILYDALKDKKEKYILIGTLTFLTLMPKIVTSFKIAGTWADIIPDYWQINYPITIFFIGKLIRELQPKFTLRKKLSIFAIALTIPCLFCFLFSMDGEYAWYIFNGHEALTNVLIAISIFLIFYDINKDISIITKAINQISICSFEMYLFSSIIDKYVYSHTTSHNLFIIIPIVLVSTYICARILIWLRNFLIEKIFDKHES